MVELVDTPDLGSGAAMRVGSSPIRRTKAVRDLSIVGNEAAIDWKPVGLVRFFVQRNRFANWSF